MSQFPIESFLIVLFLLPVSGKAKPPSGVAQSSLAQAVAWDLNALFSDTINEGESSAEVLNVQNEPQVFCSSPQVRGGNRVVFCSVDIKTIFQSGDEERTGGTRCQSLGYVLNESGQILSRHIDGKVDQFDLCLNQVYDASYD